MKIRVLLVEDQKIMQKYFASMVQGDERFLLVDVLNDGEKAVSYCNHTVVDLVLMDVQTFQNHDGLLAAETIKKQHLWWIRRSLHGQKRRAQTVCGIRITDRKKLWR